MFISDSKTAPRYRKLHGMIGVVIDIGDADSSYTIEIAGDTYYPADHEIVRVNPILFTGNIRRKL